MKGVYCLPYFLFLKKRQNLKLSSAAKYRWRFEGFCLTCHNPTGQHHFCSISFKGGVP